MNPTDPSVAWEHSPTRRAWSKQLAMNVVALVAWIASWFALLAVLSVFLGPGYAVVVAPFLVYSFYRAFLQIFVIAAVFRMRRVLRVYPWQLSHQPRTASPTGPMSSANSSAGSSSRTRPGRRSDCPWCSPGTGVSAGGADVWRLVRRLNSRPRSTSYGSPVTPVSSVCLPRRRLKGRCRVASVSFINRRGRTAGVVPSQSGELLPRTSNAVAGPGLFLSDPESPTPTKPLKGLWK